MDISTLTADERKALRKALAKDLASTKPPLTKEQRAERKAARMARAKANKPRQPGKKRKGGISLRPSTDARQSLVQVSKLIGSAWRERPQNPAVELLTCDVHVSGRINSFAAGRWTQRRTGEDTMLVTVKLKDGSEEARNFRRTIIDTAWKRA